MLGQLLLTFLGQIWGWVEGNTLTQPNQYCSAVLCIATVTTVVSDPDLIWTESLHNLLLPPTSASAGPVKSTLMGSCRGPLNGVKFSCWGPRNGVKFGFWGPKIEWNLLVGDPKTEWNFNPKNIFKKNSWNFWSQHKNKLKIPPIPMPTGLMVKLLKIVPPPL